MTKILYWDIESAFMTVGAWGLRNNDYISPDLIVSEWFIIMASFADISDVRTQDDIKDMKVTNVALTDKMWRFKKDFTDDYYVVKTIRDTLEKYDIIVAHNGDKFDLKKLNARMIKHGLEPLPPILTVDTLKEARKVFAFSSNKLSYLAEFLGLEQQKGSASGAWHKILKGNTKDKVSAIDDMLDYCDQDIRTGVAVYLELLKYMKSHPNVADDGTYNCPKCNSDNVQKRGIRKLKSGTQKQEYSCNECGTFYRSRKTEKNKPLSTL